MLLLGLLLLTACGGGAPIPAEDLLLRIETGATEVPLGAAFPLTVVRVWKSDLVPQAWSDEALAPLRVRLIDTRRREQGDHVEERRRYHGYAFATGVVQVPAPEFRAVPKRGGLERRVRGNALELRVTSALDPANPGDVELPGGPLLDTLQPPFPWVITAGVVALLLAGAALVARRRHPAPQPVVEEVEPAPRPDEIALRRIEELRAQPAGDHAEEFVAMLRIYLAERFDRRTRELTSPELAAIPTDSAQRELLGALLRDYDLVLYARHEPSPAAGARMLDAAADFVRRSA